MHCFQLAFDFYDTSNPCARVGDVDGLGHVCIGGVADDDIVDALDADGALELRFQGSAVIDDVRCAHGLGVGDCLVPTGGDDDFA